MPDKQEIADLPYKHTWLIIVLFLFMAVKRDVQRKVAFALRGVHQEVRSIVEAVVLITAFVENRALDRLRTRVPVASRRTCHHRPH